MGHYHCTTRKWDPGPFDFKKFCEKLRGALCFPLWTGSKDPAPGEKPAVPTNLDDLIKRVRELNDANEKRARGGFFPVGPWGEHRIWHGGVHLKAKAGQQVFAPFPGRIVCARMGKSTPAGSANFVLLRHNMAIGKSPLRFYSLYMHLRDELTETDPSQQPAWMQKDAWKTKGGKGKEVLLDEPVEAGEVIGRVGVAGPGDMSEPQIHFEIFSPDELFTEMGDSRWILMDGSAGSRICDLDDIINKIDADKDKRLSKDEITGFYSGNSSALDLTHQWVALSVSEWTPEPDWKETLRTASDFAALPPDYVDRMVDEQITETLWWTEEVAKHCRLPVDGVVYHYQPVAFLRFVNQAIVEAALKEPDVKVDAKEARAVPKDILDDFGDVTGESAVVLGHDGQVDIYQNLTLEQILQGYQGDTL